MIPYVGPWMGTIPCALILLMVKPSHAIAFVIIVIIAQQIDSNLIYPRVVGTSVGLPAIWVLFAITVGGGLFNVLGMIVGVPIMSIIYTVIREKTTGSTDSTENKSTPKPRQWHIRKSVQSLRSRVSRKGTITEKDTFKKNKNLSSRKNAACSLVGNGRHLSVLRQYRTKSVWRLCAVLP